MICLNEVVILAVHFNVVKKKKNNQRTTAWPHYFSIVLMKSCTLSYFCQPIKIIKVQSLEIKHNFEGKIANFVYFKTLSFQTLENGLNKNIFATKKYTLKEVNLSANIRAKRISISIVISRYSPLVGVIIYFIAFHKAEKVVAAC